ncbi:MULTISPECIES: dihydroneopterin aldolase [unclassified Colwellia]|uniref:dihydroneopterin aldolase n=1 Tax=unclassified Colwellia TaxID=196834 RepID=UPI000D368442|nr:MULTISPECIES: dihydroneopterin aldolase [unclassified Colwellia]AWB58795.1 dihydroneopterin aldolase [Colwellia sp. Arc7-D]MBA6414743.1 dihydroneopterin aldolase [Colwellia sp. 6M3]
MDKVYIEGLTFQTTIGFYAWEKEIKQTLVIDLAMGWNTAEAAKNDELSKTLDYAAISEAIVEFANANPVDLIETLAERIAEFLIANYQIPWLRLKLMKPNAVHNATTVGVEIERVSQKLDQIM